MIVEGAIVDADGPRAAYVRFQGERVAEVGKIGTDSTHGSERRIRGIVIPPPVNGHIHLGDAVSTREPPTGPLERLVKPPDGWKFTLLRSATASAKRRAIAAAVARMGREGIAAAIDFREEGEEGLRLLRRATRGSRVRIVALGRPLERPILPEEVERVLELSDGIGLSSAREESHGDRARIGTACKKARKLFGMHASENVREDPDVYLDPRPDLLVHLTEATDADLEQVARAGVTVAVCPRSNALFGRRPRLSALERIGVPTVLGTDNVMFHAPSIWRELEFAYVSNRLAGERVSPEFLVRAACVTPWNLLGEPEQARVQADGPSRPIVVRLPPDDPAYQLVGRATEHLIVRPASAKGGKGPG
ncbi:MAG: amidohydrolase family protein [Thermoplasmata archaeon]|nr:amidohydrolase family protein [Thermoplasmata archaeon]MCI4359250.1 amidohydrolase family protein [Thermoplasmata archaeon]